MKKLLYVCSNSDLAGAPKHVTNLINLCSEDFEIKAIFGGKGEILDYTKFNNFVLLKNLSSSINFKKDLKAYKQIKNQIKIFNPDIIHMHSFKASLLVRIYNLFNSLDSTLVYTVHGWPWRGKNILIKFITYLLEASFAIINRNLNYIFVDKKSFENFISKFFIKNKSLIFNGVPFDIEKNKIKEQSTYPHFLFVSRIAHGKRHDIAIQAFDLFIKQGGNGFLHFIGEGTNDSQFIKSFINFEQIADNVFFHGQINNQCKIYNKGDVVLLISDFEALPLSLIEGLSYSKPLIASDVGSVNEIVNENTGILLKSHNLEEISNSFHVMSSKILRDKIASQSLNHFHSKFSEDCIKKDILKIYLK